MKRIISLIIMVIMGMNLVTAQEKKAIITFENTSHDFGTFAEAMGKVTTHFKFTNTGTAPLLITRTAASCGCTTPTYPKEPIAPGGTGVISVTYNAKNRPGVFQKTVYVMANTDPDRTKLLIRGDVQRDEMTQKLQGYRGRIEQLYLKSRYLPLFDIASNERRTEQIQVFNSSDEDLLVSFADVPKHIVVKMSPAVLKPKSEGIIEVVFDATKAGDLGMRKDVFDILLGNDKQAYKNNEVIISSEIKENFGTLTTQELENAPRIHVNTKLIKFGETDNTLSKVVEIVNEGKTDLVIHKIGVENKAFKVVPSSSSVSPGKMLKVKVTFDPKLASSKYQYAQMQVISNDPKIPNEMLKLHAIVK